MEKKKVLLAGVQLGREEDFERSMKELAGLAEACNFEVAGSVVQRLQEVNPKFLAGTGKVAEIAEKLWETDSEGVIFDNALNPIQMRNLQKELGTEVMDRTGLILEIFSDRARTREAKLQVESARLQYILPRLVGMRESLGRQGGGSGLSNKGAGEKKLELDRRHIEHRMSEVRKELEAIGRERETQRKKRLSSGIPRVALVGYTNAGKSTLMNSMLRQYAEGDEKGVLEKDMLFATLDTTVRKISPGGHRTFLLSDTVGFIHELPHNLIQAFRATLEEAKYADVLWEVIDYSDEHYKEQKSITEDTLREIGAGGLPVVYIYNKSDLVEEKLPVIEGNRIFLSAKTGVGLEELISLTEAVLQKDHVECELLLPYQEGGILSYLKENADISFLEYGEDGISVRAGCRKQDLGKVAQYMKNS